MKGFLLALQFLTIFPLKVKGNVDKTDMAGSSVFFPVVGLLQGTLLLAVGLVLENVFHPEIFIALILLVHVLINGGLHLDGLADTFDALAVRGDRQRKLEVMKDGSVGAIGVAAIIFTLALKYLSLKAISGFSLYAWYSTLISMPIISKFAMLISMYAGKPARDDGTGKIFMEGLRGSHLLIASAMAFIYLEMPVIFLNGDIGPLYHLFSLVTLTLIGAASFFLVRLFTGSFGGLTGDTLGATGEISETLFLLLVIAWHGFYIL